MVQPKRRRKQSDKDSNETSPHSTTIKSPRRSTRLSSPSPSTCTHHKTVFVTVGTTRFDGLIQLMMQSSFLDSLASQHYTRLVIQYGKSEYAQLLNLQHPHLSISAYNFKPSLLQDMQNADLIISHAGAGSILESLELKKKLIVVVNDSLMDNHQLELASELQRLGKLCMTTTLELESFIAHQHDRLSRLEPLEESQPHLFINELTSLVGFTA